MCAELTKEAAQKNLYEQAKALYQHRKLQEAAALFSSLGEYAQAGAYIKKCDMVERFTVGKKVCYGQVDGKPILWRVLEERGRMRLLFADTPVANRPYHQQYRLCSWASCSLRTWLNQEFFKTAFTPEERLTILNTKLENLPSPKFGTNGGINTADKLFPFSLREAQTYLPAERDRAIGRWWWLRTPGIGLLSVASVYLDGTIYENGVNVSDSTVGVRPAMWVLLKI